MTQLKRYKEMPLHNVIQTYHIHSYSIISEPLGFILHTVSSRSFVDVKFARLEDSRKRVPSSCQSISERLCIFGCIWLYLLEVSDSLMPLCRTCRNVPLSRLWRFNIPWQKSCTCQSLRELFSAEAVCCFWSFGPFIASHWFDWVNLENAATC